MDEKKAPTDKDEDEDINPTMTPGGAMPGGSEMSHWKTAQPNPDATKPETMPSSATQSADDA